MSRTLRGRIGVAAVGVAAVWIAVLTAAFNVLLGSRLHDEADSVLRTRAAVIVATLDTDATGPPCGLLRALFPRGGGAAW